MGSGNTYAVARSLGLVLILIIFRAILWTYNCLRSILWTINGTYSRKRAAHKPENYHRSAQVLQVLAKFKADKIVQAASLDDFLLSHVEFANPDDILFHTEVTLYNITETEAIFVEADKGVDVTAVTFVCVSQYCLARRVIILPLSSFLKVCERLPEPKTKTFVCNTTRCGSSLLVQYFQQIPSCVGVGEPEVVNTLTRMYIDKKPTDHLQKLASSVFKFMCKAPGKEHLMIKIRSPSIGILPFLGEKFPQSKFVFIYRDLMISGKSCYKCICMIPILKLTWVFGSYSESLAKFFFSKFSGFIMPDDDFYKPSVKELVKCCLFWVMSCQVYYDLRHNGFPIKAFRYEDWMERTEESITKLLEYVELPVEWAKYANVALEKDSQINTDISRDLLAYFKPPDLDQESRKFLNFKCRAGNVPTLDDSGILEATINTN